MTTISTHTGKQVQITKSHVTTSVAAATFISSGIGVFVLGLMTTGAVISDGLKNALNWTDPVGPLSGKVGIALLAWFISWAVMNARWKGQEVELPKAFKITVILIGLGFLLTFPPIFEIFA